MTILTAFLSSEFYARMPTATILGREIPFVIPWHEGQVMEGVIDLMYRFDGRIWIADYKTDRITAGETRARAQQYALQATAYRAAAERCLGGEAVVFEFVFLRPGVCVEM
jgi:ATP-dependent helicase/nuclease subunit A